MTAKALLLSITNDPTVAPTVAIIVAFVVAGCLESRRSQLHTSAQHARWISNIMLAVINYGLIGFGMQTIFVAYAQLVPAAFSIWTNSALGFIAAFLVMDLLHYWLHRMFHASSFLWRLHSVHHSDRDLDVSTTFRHHPIEFALLSGVIFTAQTVLAVSTVPTIAYAVIAGTLSVIGHANLRLPSAAAWTIGSVILTPDFHALHHSTDPKLHHRNFGSVLTIWDRMFGTYRAPESIPLRRIVFGIGSGDDLSVAQ